MGNKDSKPNDGTSTIREGKSNKKGDNQNKQTSPPSQSPSTVPAPAGGTSASPPVTNSSSSSSSITIPPSNDGVDGSTLSPNADGRVDPLVASLDKPLTRLPEQTNEKEVAKNPFGEAFKKAQNTMTVDDFELLKVIGKGSFGKVVSKTNE